MGVRYLFGDSGLFPGSTNFLEILRGFIVHVGRAAMIHAEIVSKERQAAEASETSEVYLQQVAAYFEDALTGLQSAGQRHGAVIEPLSRDLMEFTRRLHDGTRSRSLAEVQSLKDRTARETGSLRGEIPSCLNAFFVQAPLEERSWAFSLKRTAEAVEASSVVTFDQEIEAAYALEPDHEWGRPRRVAEFADNINLQIGMKKKFLRSGLVPEVVPIGDYVITSLELTDEVAELILRKRIETEEGSLLLRIQTAAGEPPMVEVIKNGGGDEVHAASPEETADVVRLINALKAAVAVTRRRKRRTLWVRIGAKDVLEHNLLVELIEQLVEMLAPLAQEIDRRSPNRHELSLKVEHSDGRREEIYLKKEDLAQPLAGLPLPLWKIFGRLGVLPAAS
ncbi:MAG: hypothetical protein R3B09_03305 [Nannocystaceae bacterium]